MPYGTIKVDNITFTDNSVDKTVSLSGLIQNPTFTGNVTVTGTISGDVIRGGTTISGVTITGTTANFVSGVFTTQVSGATILATTGTFTSLTGTTTTGTTANFVSGVFTTQLSGATITGTTVSTTTGSFVSLTGTTATFTSGIIASGTAALPSLAILSDPNTGIYSPGADQLAISTNGTSRIVVDASGNVNIDSNTFYVDAANNRVGIGTTSPATLLDLSTTTSAKLNLTYPGFGIATLASDSSGALLLQADEANTQASSLIQFKVDGSEAARIDSSRRLLVGTSTTSATSTAVFASRSDAAAAPLVALHTTESTVTNDSNFGTLSFGNTASSGTNAGAFIQAQRDGGTWTNNSSMPGRLTFSTTADGAASPTERMRIRNNGNILLATGGNESAVNARGVEINGTTGFMYCAVDSDTVAYFNRRTNDGTIIEFRQDNTTEGSISVSGTTVSYNGAHLSRWSQLPGGATREEILRGSVLSNINEMCEWPDEDNEQLNRMKVSDVEGDKNVSGVFQAWDDDDDTYTDDFYCAMTGDFIIRIAEGVTVERGDLLMSAGDGTAKPQDDDIIRSKTVAKVTSTNVSCTYEDGSYCVPCVLMAC